MSSDVSDKLVSLCDIENGWKWIKEDCVSKQINHEEAEFAVTKLVNYSSYQKLKIILKKHTAYTIVQVDYCITHRNISSNCLPMIVHSGNL